ncbi:hypothetical protein [Streptomyces sp. NPDC060366]|uniref:hypothetical protein n=1 Tax=Streptomyces sp. NPDC060366 TaxID=3347105 RepID=UPI003661F5DD
MSAVSDDEHERERSRDQQQEQEEELRVLLERAVPRLPAPEERLRRVRERAGRSRRRRRVARTAVVAVTGLVVAGTFLPGFLRGDPGEGAPPASPAPTVTADGATGVRAVRFPDLRDLTLRLPTGWQALAVPGDPAHATDPRGFVADHRVPTIASTCGDGQRSGCDPFRALRPGGVLVSLDLRKFTGLHTKVRDPAELYALDEPSPLCRKLKGTQEYGALLAGPDPGADIGIQVSVCVAGAGAGSPILDDVRAMIAGAKYPALGADREPSKAPPAYAN